MAKRVGSQAGANAAAWRSPSFNSSLGWCPACEGLGVQTGANPAALLRSSKATLAEGAVALWPSAGGKIFPLMLDAFARATGIPTDVPFDQLGAKHRRLIMHGTEDRWFDVQLSGKTSDRAFAA